MNHPLKYPLLVSWQMPFRVCRERKPSAQIRRFTFHNLTNRTMLIPRWDILCQNPAS